MLGKEEVESILNQLKQEWGSDPNWEQLLRDVYVGIARADGGVALGDLDQGHQSYSATSKAVSVRQGSGGSTSTPAGAYRGGPRASVGCSVPNPFASD